MTSTQPGNPQPTTTFDPNAPAYPASSSYPSVPSYPGTYQETAMTAYPQTLPAVAPADPGRTLGIVGLVLAFVANVVGLVVSIVALRRSRRAGFKNGVALAGVVVGGLSTLALVLAVGLGGLALGGVAKKCQELGPGTHVVNGVTYTCG